MVKNPLANAEDVKQKGSRGTQTERDTCTSMFIAALFIIARTWKQPRCPSVDKWIRKLWYIYTVELSYLKECI